MCLLAALFFLLPGTTLAERCPVIPVGANIAGHSYWTSAIMFKDLAFQSGGWAVLKKSDGTSCPGVSYDSNGWPKFSSDCYGRIWLAFHISDANWSGTSIKPYKGGQYVLRYEGTGQIALGWDAKNAKVTGPGRMTFDVPTPKDGIEIRIVTSDPADYVREISVVHVDDESSYKTQPFNEDYLNVLRRMNVKVLRFMDTSSASQSINVWSGNMAGRTATTVTLPSSAPTTIKAGQIALVGGYWPRIFVKSYDAQSRVITLEHPLDLSKVSQTESIQIIDFPNRTWSSRTKMSQLQQGGSSGIALEYMIQLANTLDVDPWLSIPPAADDNWIREAATLFKQNLKAGRKPYFEWANESWNYGYPAYHYSEAMMRKLGLGAGVWIPADAYQAYRFVEMARIISDVYQVSPIAAERSAKPFYAVLTSQTAWVDRAKAVMDWSQKDSGWPTNGKKAFQFADDFAVTFYWARPDGSKDVTSATIDELIDYQIQDQNKNMSRVAPIGYQFQIAKEVTQRGMRLVMYEGGTHLLADNREDAAQVGKLVTVNRDPRMKEVFLNALTLWQGLREQFGEDKVGVFMQFNDVGRYSKYGYWGQMESTYQDPATAPKHQAYIDWSKKCQPPSAPRGLAIR